MDPGVHFILVSIYLLYQFALPIGYVSTVTIFQLNDQQDVFDVQLGEPESHATCSGG